MTPSFRPSGSAPAPSSDTPWGVRKPPLPPQEAALVGVIALHLCFLPWALGTMHGWSQLLSLSFSLLGFFLAVLPRSPDRNFPDGGSAGRRPAGELRRYPIFWAGLALLGYIALQALNPAWRFASDNVSWWLDPVTHFSWLPSGVEAPFERSNPWRALVVLGSAWLLVCSVRIGFLRRKSYRVLFTLLVANAALVALLGVVQKWSGANRIFWSYLPSSDAFIASFVYPNHAGPYFYLMAALAAGLAWWHYARAKRRVETAALGRSFTTVAFFIGAAVVLSYSRMSIVLLLAFAAAIGAILAFRRWGRAGAARDHPEFLPLALLLSVIAGTVLGLTGTEKLRARFATMASNPAAQGRERALARQATTDMLRDRWLLGWGAGCFRYGFPLYAQKYPEIYEVGNGGRQYWEHAHDDLLEFPAELGVIGMLPLAGMFGWSASQLSRRRFWINPVTGCAVLGCALVLVHAWVDFVFQNPAVLCTWSVLLTGTARWAELDPSREHDVSAESVSARRTYLETANRRKWSRNKE